MKTYIKRTIGCILLLFIFVAAPIWGAIYGEPVTKFAAFTLIGTELFLLLIALINWLFE